MRAAQQDDTIAMKRLALGEQPIRWLERLRAHAPGFFQQSRTLDELTYAESDHSMLTLYISVVYHGFEGLCQRADPPDILIVDVTLEAGVWRITGIMNQIC